jgi:hypothetical protein
MDYTLKPRRLWQGLAVLLYGLNLAIAILYADPHMFSNFGMYYWGFVYENDRLGDIADFVLIGTTLGLPILVAALVLYRRTYPAATKAAAAIIGFFYSIIAVQLVNVKLYTCTAGEATADPAWQCQASGSDFEFLAVLVALLAGSVWIGLKTEAWLLHKFKR